jgi:hypothetical protein
LSYRHTFDADSDALKFTAQAGEAVTVQGFSSGAIRVFDITDANNVEELTGKIEEAKAGGSAVTVAAQGSGEHLLLALTESQTKLPTRIRAAHPSTIEQNAELLIITASDFFPALEPLKKQRQTDGYQTALIDVEDIYDAYSFGNKSPQAIRDFLAYAKANWKVKPRFVLLAGDASYDARNYLGFGDTDIVPTKLLDTAFLETASDDWFSDFNNDGIAEIATGRLPFHSLSEATVMVAKTLRYGAAKSANAALLVSDTNDGFDFEQAAAQLRALLPGRIKAEDLKRGQLDAETAKRNLFAAIERGETLVNYNGHGSVNLWRGGLLTADEARTMENQQLPLFVLMNCLNGYYVDAGGESLGEALLKAEQGGAAAVWASAGLTEPQAQIVLNQELYRALFQKRGMTLGEAIQQAKAATSDADLRRTWILLGDPTLRIR